MESKPEGNENQRGGMIFFLTRLLHRPKSVRMMASLGRDNVEN